MIQNVKRISIIGGCGTGKTTLANSLGEELSFPVYHIDGMHHLENWEIRDKEERDRMILEKVSEDKWVIDGTYSSTLKQRGERSDLIIFLDYSSVAQMKGVLGRYIKNHGKEKLEIPGCKERMTLEFFIYTLNWRKNKRKKIIENINYIDKNKILIFKNRRELNNWYKKEFNRNIKCT